jgi:hypothetical protein
LFHYRRYISNAFEDDAMTTATVKHEITYFQASRTYSSTVSALKGFFCEQYEVCGRLGLRHHHVEEVDSVGAP